MRESCESTPEWNGNISGLAVTPIKTILGWYREISLLMIVFFNYLKREDENMIDIKLIRENKELVKENIKISFKIRSYH